MGFLRRLNPLRQGGRLDVRANEEVAEKAGIATRSALVRLDEDLPALTALLSGEPVKLEVSLRLKVEPDEDA
jgi:hypothetical protein